jgi:pSer/pThr/pTyr-binding forkhead associated (FHA) protein
VVLNPIYRAKDLGNSKIYMMVSFSESKEMIIGRKNDSDIIISSDSTVGRHNSKIVFESARGDKPGRFVLYDLDSKFGTLVLLRKSFHMAHELNGTSLQFGGDVVQFKVGNKSKGHEQINVEDPVNNFDKGK